MTQFINFKSRDFGYKGDKFTTVRIADNGDIIVKKAASGIISSAYSAELTEYCSQYGADFNSLPFGESVTIGNIKDKRHDDVVIEKKDTEIRIITFVMDDERVIVRCYDRNDGTGMVTDKTYQGVDAWTIFDLALQIIQRDAPELFDLYKLARDKKITREEADADIRDTCIKSSHNIDYASIQCIDPQQ